MAKAYAAVSIGPAEADLRAAYGRLRVHGWPDTFEAAMQHPTYARVLQINARHAHAVPPPQRPNPWPFMAAAKYRPAPAANASTWRATPQLVDLKRAAAGDRDD
jgi:hypothetical protein